MRKSNRKGLLSGIILTLVCLGPFGNLIFLIVTHEFENLLGCAIATFPTLLVIGAYWCWYIMLSVQVEDKIEKHLKNSRNKK